MFIDRVFVTLATSTYREFEMSRLKVMVRLSATMMITRILLLGTLLTLIGTAFPAFAATKHYRVTHAHSAIYNRVPDSGCPANGGPSCSNAGPAAVEY
jgi:hypothetical protein